MLGNSAFIGGLNSGCVCSGAALASFDGLRTGFANTFATQYVPRWEPIGHNLVNNAMPQFRMWPWLPVGTGLLGNNAFFDEAEYYRQIALSFGNIQDRGNTPMVNSVGIGLGQLQGQLLEYNQQLTVPVPPIPQHHTTEGGHESDTEISVVGSSLRAQTQVMRLQRESIMSGGRNAETIQPPPIGHTERTIVEGHMGVLLPPTDFPEGTDDVAPDAGAAQPVGALNNGVQDASVTSAKPDRVRRRRNRYGPLRRPLTQPQQFSLSERRNIEAVVRELDGGRIPRGMLSARLAAEVEVHGPSSVRSAIRRERLRLQNSKVGGTKKVWSGRLIEQYSPEEDELLLSGLKKHGNGYVRIKFVMKHFRGMVARRGICSVRSRLYRLSCIAGEPLRRATTTEPTPRIKQHSRYTEEEIRILNRCVIERRGLTQAERALMRRNHSPSSYSWKLCTLRAEDRVRSGT